MLEKMKYALAVTTLAAGVALASGSAYAADLMQPGVVSAPAPAAISGLYVSVFAGAAFPHAVHGNYTDQTTTTSADIPLQTGYILGATIGTHLMPNLRGEIELSYASHGVTGTETTHSTGGARGTSADSGSFNTLYLLGNLWYDFDTGGSFTPYLGGGLGVAVMMPNVSFPTFIGTPSFSTSSAALAGQLGAGVKFQIADNMSLDLGYRVKGVFGGGLTQTNYPNNLKNVNYIDQTIQVGLDIGF
jgi:opacity protein-like surface antigen